MTKAALDAVTLGLAQDPFALNITANVIAPGPCGNRYQLAILEIRRGIGRTDRTSTHRGLQDVANLAHFRASRGSQWITGQYMAARRRISLVEGLVGRAAL
jgi:NAD(P)-dependent dehydrogenase (short-subunit alcohol dehydrogenase family)